MLMDIMEVEGKPLAKRGKWSGSKRVLKCPKCGTRKIVPNAKQSYICSCRKRFEDIIRPVLDKGKQLIQAEIPSRLRKSVLQNVKNLPLE